MTQIPHRLRYMLALAVVLTALWSLPQAARAETEPNDTIATASTIGIGLANAEINATISTTNDLDYYRFEAAAAGQTFVIQTFNISGQRNGNGTKVRLYNSGGTLLETGTFGTGSADKQIIYTFTSPGTYFLLVTRADFTDWTGGYSLRVLPKYDQPGAAWDEADGFEPNDVRELATPITPGLGNALTRTLFDNSNLVSGNSDYDYYRFEVTAGQTFVIQTFNISGQRNGNGTKVRLYNSGGTLLETGTFGTGSADKQIIYTFTSPGTYFLLVTRADFTDWTGGYSLRVLPKYDQPGAAWDEADGFEPNDVRELATPITPGLGNALTRTLFDNSNLVSGNSDYDYYRFEVTAGQTFVIQTFNISGQRNGSGTQVRLYNSGGTLLETGAFGTGSADKQIVYTFTSPGTYFLLVTRADFTNWTGGYSLRVLPKYDQPGAAWDEADGFEPNDVRELATPITPGLGNALTRTLFDNSNLVSGNSDYDYYRFEVTAGQTFVIQTFSVAGALRGSGTQVRLYNSGGTLLETGAFGTGSTDKQIVYTFTSPGTYFLLVTRADFTDWTGSYSLRVLPKYDQPGAAWNEANDFEPNDLPELATRLELGAASAVNRQIQLNANLVSGDIDVDYYRIEVAAGQRIVIQTFNVQVAAGNVGTGLVLFNSTGTRVSNSVAGRGNVHREINAILPNAGTYFVRVTRQDFSSWTGTYSLRACVDVCQQRVHLPLVRR